MVVFDPVKFMGFVAGSSLLGAVLLLGTPAKSQDITSQYSKVDEGSCMTLLVDEESGFSQQVCKGVDGVAVFVAEGDLRQSVSYRDQLAGDRQFTFSGFNRIGETIEWRLKDDGNGWQKPFATILRWYVSLGGTEKEEQALVVTKLEQDNYCVAGFVEATAQSDANALARDIADTVAADFVCGTDKPMWHGQTGPLAQSMQY